MAQSQYLRRVQAINRNQGPSDVDRGIAVGQQVGKLLGGLSEAIKGAQKDALANKLMNTQDAPRAALVSAGVRSQEVPIRKGSIPLTPMPISRPILPSDVSQTIGGRAPSSTRR